MKRLLAAVLVCLLCAPFAIAAEKEKESKPARQGRYVEVAGVIVEIDATTGRLRPLAADVKAALLKGLDRLLSRPTSGLPETKSATGETTVDVSDHFQHALISYVEDGQVRTECVEDLNYALAILFPANDKSAAAAAAKRETE